MNLNPLSRHIFFKEKDLKEKVLEELFKTAYEIGFFHCKSGFRKDPEQALEDYTQKINCEFYDSKKEAKKIEERYNNDTK